MKTAHLKKRFYAFGQSLAPPFAIDASAKGDPAFRLINQRYAVIKRSAVSGQWQFMALQFNPLFECIYLELGLSPDEDFFKHSELMFVDPESYQAGQSIFFRAASLWTGENSKDAWFIRPRKLDINELYAEAGSRDMKELLLYLADKGIKSTLDPDMAAWELNMQWQDLIIHGSECFFQNDQEALDSIESRITEYVLPYFERMSQRHLQAGA